MLTDQTERNSNLRLIASTHRKGTTCLKHPVLYLTVRMVTWMVLVGPLCTSRLNEGLKAKGQRERERKWEVGNKEGWDGAWEWVGRREGKWQEMIDRWTNWMIDGFTSSGSSVQETCLSHSHSTYTVSGYVEERAGEMSRDNFRHQPSYNMYRIPRLDNTYQYEPG
jgi:hypothetical protein